MEKINGGNLFICKNTRMKKGGDQGGSEVAHTAKRRERGMQAAGCMQLSASLGLDHGSSYYLIKLYSKLS